jgi:lipoprotein-anchoring transpeptidase ErfK/SrfK
MRLFPALLAAALAVPAVALAGPGARYSVPGGGVGSQDGGFIAPLLQGRSPDPSAPIYRPLPVDPLSGLPLGRPVQTGPVRALPPSYAFDPESEGLGVAVAPEYRRQEVAFAAGYRPGTIVIDTPQHFLYLVLEGGRALRYGIGVGKDESLVFRGTATIGRKAEWPRWTPTVSMIKREPDRYGPYAGGMDGGPTNPLGPRALYLYHDGRDTLFRLHGTTEPYTIGTNVSSGCIRLMNQDIIDLYARVPTGARVVVIN